MNAEQKWQWVKDKIEAIERRLAKLERAHGANTSGHGSFKLYQSREYDDSQRPSIEFLKALQEGVEQTGNSS